jgi:hypothetical protein
VARCTQSDPAGMLGTLRMQQHPGRLSVSAVARFGREGFAKLFNGLRGEFFAHAPGLPSNLYAYGHGNPEILIDPSGHEVVLCTVFRDRAKPTPSPAR